MSRSIKVEVDRLDAIMAREQFSEFILLKVDVQGLELSVLEGSTGLLDQVMVIVCEANVAALYQGQTELEDLFRFCREHHFDLVDFAEPIRARETAELLYLDLAWLRRPPAA